MSKYFLFLTNIVFSLALIFLIINKLHAQVDTDTMTLIVDVQPMIALSVSSNTYNFGSLTAGSPKKGDRGIEAAVTTNSPNGYNLSISDGTSGSNSSMVHLDMTTYIADFSASITNPSLWNRGVSKGIGMTVYSADTNKESKWGNGTTFDDDLNKYAGIPETFEVIHTSMGFKNDEDYTGLAFAIDVNTDQKTGVYSGDVVLSATTNL